MVFLSKLLAVIFILAPLTIYAETHALLVGVSNYPSLRPDLRLHGSRNDVDIMRSSLLRMGVLSKNISILADGHSLSREDPTRNNILNAMKNLVKTAHSDDWVVLYLTGHGSEQPQVTKNPAYTEPNGVDEIFLPYDIGHWNGEKGAIENAILDDEIGAILEQLSKNKVYVWLIIDSCHSGGMNREDSCSSQGCTLERAVPARILGVPMDKVRGMQTKKSISEHKNPAPTYSRQIHFFAAPPNDLTLEKDFSDVLGKSKPFHYGFFTYQLSIALKNWDGDFPELEKRVRQGYRENTLLRPWFVGNSSKIPNFPVK
jgi:hypothetical protein